MSQPLEDKDSPALQTRLKEIGFVATEFEPKVSNRFIVRVDGIPSHVIKAVTLPRFSAIIGEWEEEVQLTCYNPVDLKMEETLLAMAKQEKTDIQIDILAPTAEVVTTWKIVGTQPTVNFGPLDWSDKGQPLLLYIRFQPNEVTITYPTR
jgi:hypothetical protein